MNHDRSEFIHMSRFLILYDIQELREYLCTVETLLKDEAERWSAAFDRRTAGWTEERRTNYFADHGDAYQQLSEIFPSIIMGSAFLVCYSFLEVELDIVCRFLEDASGSHKQTRQSRTRDVTKSMDLLQRATDIFRRQSHERKDVLAYKDIRNCIIHRRGRIEGANTRLRALASSTAGLTVDGYDQIRITGEFCSHVVDTIESLLDRLLAALQVCAIRTCDSP